MSCNFTFLHERSEAQGVRKYILKNIAVSQAEGIDG